MALDQALYRHEVCVSTEPQVHLSVIDIAPEHYQQTIVFIHGFGGEAKQWVYQLDQFSDNNRVIAIDLRGHGRSAKPKRGLQHASHPKRSGSSLRRLRG